ncbi:MAG: 16S rRNA (cytosine(967)-C(5))-methyltransferase RsmB, partial [Oscillospiraceae bacterium]
VPESAAVNESVNLIKSTPKVGASGFVNGVLRSFIRNRCCILLPPKTDKYRRAEVEYSLPQWIIKLWERDYSYPAAISLAKACMGRPPLHFRINTLKISVEKAKELLTAQHMTVSKHPLLPNCLTVEQSGSIAQMKAYRQGMFYVQDASSQLCAEALGAMPGERIFDLCAAPGSKSFTIAQLMENQGEILSFDLYEQRVKLIAESVERLSITCIKAMLGDACQYNEKLGVADRVLCDVPCSGLGIIRRKPEIKYKSQEEVEKLPIIQRKILENGAKYVRSGGVLVYSTCSLNKDENNRVVKWFLENHPEFEPDPLPEKFQKITGKVSYTVTLAPHKGGFDGFFIARLKKK